MPELPLAVSPHASRSPSPSLHVQPNPRGRWIVRHEGDREPVSEHESATEAERVACKLAHLEGTSAVLVHDLYARVHCLVIGDRPGSP